MLRFIGELFTTGGVVSVELVFCSVEFLLPALPGNDWCLECLVSLLMSVRESPCSRRRSQNTTRLV